MLKRIVAVLFAVSVFVPQPVEASPKAVYPSWVDGRVNAGERCRRWEQLLRQHGLPVKPFSYIAWRESRCNPKAWNKFDPATGSYGVWQINGSWVTVTAQVCRSTWGDRSVLWDATCNARVAAYLFREAGFRPWGW